MIQLKKREFCTFLLFFFSRHFTKSMEPSIMRVFESVSDAFERNASFSFLSHSLTLSLFSLEEILEYCNETGSAD
jgi:hypothetical protein